MWLENQEAIMDGFGMLSGRAMWPLLPPEPTQSPSMTWPVIAVASFSFQETLDEFIAHELLT
jgi:hypothetical protein